VCSGPVAAEAGDVEPGAATGPEHTETDAAREAREGRHDGAPWVVAHRSAARADGDLVSALAERIAGEPRGLILAGQLRTSSSYPEAVARLAAVSGYPVLAEPTGGLRFGPHDRGRVVTGYDAIVRSQGWVSDHPAGVILRLGRSFAWKHVARYLEQQPGAFQAVVDPDSSWDDPTRLAGCWLGVYPEELCHALADQVAATLSSGVRGVAEERGARGADLGLPENAGSRGADGARHAADAERQAGERAASPWLAEWQRADEVARSAVRRLTAEGEPGTVGWVYPSLLDQLPDGAVLYAANSMAVRDLDTYTGPSERRVQVIANRGASGIDGTISSALGAAWGSGRPTVLVTGDLAFVHDLNGLGAARLPGLEAVVIVLNDRGGGIFAHLPIAEARPDLFEPFFRLPSAVDVAMACAAYGVPHSTAGDPATFGGALSRALAETGVKVIEVPLDMEANTAAHRRLWEAVADALG